MGDQQGSDRAADDRSEWIADEHQCDGRAASARGGKCSATRGTIAARSPPRAKPRQEAQSGERLERRGLRAKQSRYSSRGKRDQHSGPAAGAVSDVAQKEPPTMEPAKPAAKTVPILEKLR